MIICPTCKEEIDDDSHYCDQCGQALSYCVSCGRVGIGKCCIYCGGQMGDVHGAKTVVGTPVLTLINAPLGIRIVASNGAVIGRRQGPYKKVFEQNMYVSGLHAQLVYDQAKGWGIVDKRSSNGTKVNNDQVHPEQFVSLSDGDIVAIANVNLQVKIV